MRIVARLAGYLVAFCIGAGAAELNPHEANVHHFVFFNRDRERISDATFLNLKALEGAQIKYTWRELEKQKDEYNFAEIQSDLTFLQSKGKKLFIQIQDTSFDTNIVTIPQYLLRDAEYHGGVALQYSIKNDDEANVIPEGWVARRWDPAVQERFERLLLALGRQFDGQIEGINLAETAVDFGETGKLFPKGFTPEVYRNAILTNMLVLKRAFPRSVAMEYANFMPGGQPYLQSLYEQGKESKVAFGGPDLLPYKPGQMQNCYPLIRECAGVVPTGIAVQDGNYQHVDPKTGRQVTIAELVQFATEYLRVDYIFWCTQEPFYSRDLIPFLRTKQ
jgi:hypothetical protein